jgi:hypothetical protein
MVHSCRPRQKTPATNRPRHNEPMRAIIPVIVLLLTVPGCGGGENREGSPPPVPEDRATWRELAEKADRNGVVPVVVTLDVETRLEEELTGAERAAQRRRIAEAQRSLIRDLNGTKYENLKTFESIPVVAAHVSPEALDVLRASNDVAGVEEDRLSPGA